MGRVSRKLVTLGDGGCGKTSLLTVYIKGVFPSEYEPTVFENHNVTLDVDGQEVELSLWDTAGQEELRSLSYADTHVVLVCFEVDRPVSLENVETKWMPEVRQNCPGVKVILAALKCDLRDEPQVVQKLATQGQHPVSYDEGLAVAKKIKATRYLECSAMYNRGVQEAIQTAAQVAVGAKGVGVGGRGGGDGHGRGCCVVM